MTEVHHKEDLLEFSQMQMNNFIEGIKEKRRQRDIMAKASEIEMRGLNIGGVNDKNQDQHNLRLVYKDGPEAKLPDSILKIIDKAKAKRVFKGKGKNDIESLI